MPIVSSEIVSAVTQADTSISVQERHIDHNGVVYDQIYIAPPGLDINTVLAERAVKLSIFIDNKEAVDLEAANFVIPIRMEDFLLRLTSAERSAIREAAKTDTEVDDILFIAVNRREINIQSATTQGMLDTLVTKGLLTSQRIAEITV